MGTRTHSEILSDLHYLKQYVLPLFQLGGYVPDLKIKVDKDIEAAVAELVETDPDGTLVGHWMVGEKPLDARGELLDLFPIGIIGDLYKKALTPHYAGSQVFDRGIDDGIIRNRHQRIVQCTDPGAAEPDILNGAFASGNPDRLADAERLFEHNQHRAKQICETVAGRQRHGDAAHAQPGNNRIGRKTEFVGALDQKPEGDHDTGEARSQSDQLTVQAPAAQMLRIGDRLADYPAADKRQPRRAEDRVRRFGRIPSRSGVFR